MSINDLPPNPSILSLAVVHSLIDVNGKILSLYAFGQIQRPEEIDQLEALVSVWLTCVREANRQ